MRFPDLSRLVAALLLVLLIAPFSHAGIKESKNWLVDSRAHKFLTALSENVGTEDTVLSKGHAVAALSFAGCNITILVVGPIEGDAKRYAQVIDGWRARQGFSGDVEWSQEDDCASAKYAYRPGRVGTNSGSTTVDLPALRTALLAVEPNTQFAVSDAAWSKVDLGIPAQATSSQGTRYWNLTAERGDLHPVTGSIVLRPWVAPLMLAWFLIPIVGVLASFGIGIAFAKNERLPLAQRRRLYGKAVTGGTYGVLAAHGLLVAATLPTRVFDPLAQLWFGQRFTQFAIMLVPLFAIVPMLALPFVNPVEKKLLGPSEEEVILAEPEPTPARPVETVQKPWVQRFFLVFVAVGIGLVLFSVQLPKTSEYREALRFAGFIVVFLPQFFLFRSTKLPKIVVEPETVNELDAKLKAHVETMARRLDMPVPDSRVLTEAIYGRFGAVLDKKGVGITVGALEALAPGEIDFLVAHELAHEKLGHLKRRRLLMALPFLLTVVPVAALLMGRSLVVANPAFVFTPMLIPIVLMVPFSMFVRRTMRQQEFEADRLAVQATGDAATAIATLRKVTLNSVSPGIHDIDMSTHPAVSARLAALGG